jgi:hypothetical protein
MLLTVWKDIADSFYIKKAKISESLELPVTPAQLFVHSDERKKPAKM